MREAIKAAAIFLGLAALIAGVMFCLLTGMAEARWKPEYAQLPQATRDWYESRELTAAAQARFHFKSCCAQSDVVAAKFAVSKLGGADQWFYQLAGEEKWQLVPDDIVHPDEHAPSGRAVMFAVAGIPVCFFPPDGGI